MAKLRKLVKALEADGWEKVGQRGDLVQYRGPSGRRMTFPAGKVSLPDATLAALALHAGVKVKGD
ncbi:type II toxin-antitoxin system HicA family toxin [Lacibacterium aquatile]|uniref:Type II toxin-antitoxin system HicA family toxin n=1 Tax=Lacibacterium aquatile TaxID=1168082 RepID=A0ABW5DUM4_9PROT